MTSTTSQYAAVGDFAATIGALHLINKKNQAALAGRASKGSGYAHGDAFAARAL